MPRTLSATGQVAANAENPGIAFLWTAIITPPGGSANNIYLVNNAEDISVNGQVYDARGFSIDPPEEKEDGFTSWKFSMCNVDQMFTAAIRQLSGVWYVQVLEVSASDLLADPPEFDYVERSSPVLPLKGITYDAVSLSGTLEQSNFLKRCGCKDRRDATNAPGVH